MSYLDLLQPADKRIDVITPPFNFNAPQISQYSPEVTGFHLLEGLRRRLGWSSFAGKKLLDFGCGARFAQTLINLAIEIGGYTGVDTNSKPIEWLSNNIKDNRFRFEYINMRNPLYNPSGDVVDDKFLLSLGLAEYDAACMFSVITHQTPDDAEKIFSMLEHCVKSGGFLYFSAFLHDEIEGYCEGTPAEPCLHSRYNPDLLLSLLERTGWEPMAVHPGAEFHQPIIVARKRR